MTTRRLILQLHVIIAYTVGSLRCMLAFWPSSLEEVASGQDVLTVEMWTGPGMYLGR